MNIETNRYDMTGVHSLNNNNGESQTLDPHRGTGASNRFVLRGISALALALSFVGLLAAVPAAMPLSLARDATPGIDPATLYAHVHVMGASASAGFGVRAPLPRAHPARLEPMTVARLASLARIGAGEVTGDATGLFFTNPGVVGSAQVDATIAEEPRVTMVFADDFLFWFVYGALAADRTPIKDESQRMQLLEKGLAQLNRIVDAGIPLVVGDVPDMSLAVGKMLSKAQMPKLETIARANERIHAWATDKPRVAVLRLSKLVDDLRSGKPFEAGRRSWSEESDGALIQRDQLHPTFNGTIALIACTEQAANERFLGVRQPNAPGAPVAFEHDPAKVAERVRTSVSEVTETGVR